MLKRLAVLAAVLVVGSVAYATQSRVQVVSATEISGTKNDPTPTALDAGLPLVDPVPTFGLGSPVTYVQVTVETTLSYPDAGPDQLTYGNLLAWKYTPKSGWVRWPDYDLAIPASYNIDGGGAGQSTFVSKALPILVAGPNDRAWWTTSGLETGMDAGIITVQVQGQLQQ